MTLGCRAFFREFLAEFKREGRKTNWEKYMMRIEFGPESCLGRLKAEKRGILDLLVE